MILADFLLNPEQSVRLNGNFSNYLDITVGASLLWLFYDNDLTRDGSVF